MTIRNWVINLEDGEHNIELNHGYFLGRRIIYLDGKVIEHVKYNLLDYGSKHEFRINQHHCIILIKVLVFTFSYDLIVDGISAQSDLPGNIIDDNKPKKHTIDSLPAIIGIIAASFVIGYTSSLNK